MLGAALIEQLKAGGRQLEISGVAGPLMEAAGCKPLYSAERLAVMGLVEPLGRLPELLRMRRKLFHYYRQNQPDLFVGIDAPDFNLRLERGLKAAGVPSFHYVSPSVWAWRRGRLKLIREAVDGVLTLFPFESAFYQQSDIPSRFVGHPIYQQIDWQPDPGVAKQRLGFGPQQRVIALLPGSRKNEYRRLMPLFIEVAQQLNRQHNTHFVVPLINQAARDYIEQLLHQQGAALPVTLLDGQSREAMAAADLVLQASGTATLEAMMIGRPMVVAHKLAEVSYRILKKMFYGRWIALPNLLANEPLVPELIQHEATSANIVAEIDRWFEDTAERKRRLKRFHELREQLRGEISPAEALLQWLGR